MENVIINDFNELIDITKGNFPDYVFRGHDRLYNNLTPGVFRDGFMKNEENGVKVDEASILYTFKRYTASLKYKIDVPVKNEDWLFFAQHYGLPTRLLDWSENIYKALFFAVSNYSDEDGELWLLNMRKLNQMAKFDQYDEEKNLLYNYYIEDAFTLTVNKEKLQKKYDLVNYKLNPISIFPLDISNERIKNQEGLFTLHPHNDSNGLLGNKDLFKRFIIPSKKKKEFKYNLDFMGVSCHTLFPDIEGVIKNIKYLFFN